MGIMAKDVSINITAEELKKRKRRTKRIKVTIIIILLLLMALFVVLSLVYNGGSFTVTLDPNFHSRTGMAIYTDDVRREHVRKLYAEKLEFMDNISIDWLPKDYKNFTGGSHNGENYLAYTFYIENQGSDIQSYWYTMYIEDVIRNVDEALRIKIVLNDEEKVYAKVNPLTKQPEKNTIAFYKNDQPVLENRLDFKPGDIDKITVFIWLEGDDPECIDSLLGGEIKLSMRITEEHLDEHIPTEEERKEDDKVIYRALDGDDNE